MAQGLFIGFTSGTLWVLEQVLSLVRAVAPMGICLWTPPEPCALVGVAEKKIEALCLLSW